MKASLDGDSDSARDNLNLHKVGGLASSPEFDFLNGIGLYMKVLRALFFALSMIPAGCSVVPLPEDVVGIDMAQITQKIRCEVREAIIRKIGVTLRDLGPYENDNEAVRIGTQILETGSLEGVSLETVKPKFKDYINQYAKTGIAYNFILQGVVSNNVNQGVLNVTEGIGGYNASRQLVSDGSRMFGFSGGVAATRDNTVNFTVSDDFFYLTKKVSDKYCDDNSINANYLYPIAGKLGLVNLINEFVDLNQFGNLAAPDPKNPKGPPTLAWTMKFTTSISAAATPQITLLPLTGVTRVTQGALTGSLGRTDVHTLTIALSRETKPPSEAEASLLFGGKRPAVSGTAQQQNALAAIPNSLLYIYLNNANQRPIVVNNNSLIPGVF